MGRRQGARLLPPRGAAVGEPQPDRDHLQVPGAVRADTRAGVAQRDPRRRDRGLRRPRATELLGARAADADLGPGPGSSPHAGHARHVRDLRPAVAGGALADRRDLQRPPPPARGPAADGVEPAGARVPGGPRPRAGRGSRRAGTRGGARQAPELGLPARQAHGRLAEDQASGPPGVRRRRVARRARAPAAGGSAPCCSASTTPTGRSATSGASAAASRSASWTAWRSCWTRSSARALPSPAEALPAGPLLRAPAGGGGVLHRVDAGRPPTPPGVPRPARGQGRGGGRARGRRRAAAEARRGQDRGEPLGHPVRPGRGPGARSSPTSTRSSIPRPASPRGS